MSQRVLVVDDDDLALEDCVAAVRDVLDDVTTTTSSAEAAELLRTQTFDLLIADLRMPGPDGIDLLRLAKEQDPDLAVVILTGFPSVDTAVESLKQGASDYLTKPLHREELAILVRRLLSEQQVRREHSLMERQIEQRSSFDEIVGVGPEMTAVFEAIQQTARSGVDVLIIGETGTGKELVARSIHKRSGSGGRFLPVDCGAIAEHLLESEFFGHERGAFTGAHKRSIGLMEFAKGGTLFLDEVSSLSPALQAKLLRALQERRIRRVGSTEEIEVSFRVVAASHEDLKEMVDSGRFRKDLYYRLDVGRIELPPLRERTGDVPVLVRYMVSRYGPDMGHGDVAVSAEAMAAFERHRWPGNVRELQNVIRRVLSRLEGDEIRDTDLPEDIGRGPRENLVQRGGFFQLKEERERAFERSYLTDLMRAFRGDATAAAGHAEVPRGTLYRLLKKHGLAARDFRA